MDTTTLFAGVFFGAIFMGSVVYERKQKKGIALLCGLLLCTIPYLMSNLLLLLILSCVIMSLPFFVNY